MTDLHQTDSAAHPNADPAILADVADFAGHMAGFLAGEVAPEAFRPYRTLRGVYGQRQRERYMLRVRIPVGAVAPEQLEALAEAAEDFADGCAHATTRQNFELHFVRPEGVVPALTRLGDVGLTTRESGGNTVRNVTACPLAGVCRDEVFDVTPLADALHRHFQRSPLVQKLPRKFKVALSGCSRDCAFGGIQDLGLIAAERGEDRQLRRGYRAFVAGGLGTVPLPAQLWSEFLPAAEVIPTAEALVRVFDRLGNRRNRTRARLKFLVERIGLAGLRREVEAELAALPRPAREAAGPQSDPLPSGEAGCRLARPAATSQSEDSLDPSAARSPDLARWLAANVVPQRQPGFQAVTVVLPCGDVTAPQLRALAGIARRWPGMELRTTLEQDLALRWVPEPALAEVYETLRAADLVARLGPGDVTACPGADTCAQGFTTARGLARELSGLFSDGQADGWADDPALRSFRIKISGCPNACSHYQLGQIGLAGCALHDAAGRLYPAYLLTLGGGVSADATRIGRFVGKLAAKAVPDAVQRLVGHYLAERQDGEGFAEHFDRLGDAATRALLADLWTAPTFRERPEWYVDWGASRFFSLEERGEGECAV